MDEASDVDLQPLTPSMKILQWWLGMNLQCRGVVPITIEIEGSKVCLEYHIFYKPGPTFILIGVLLRDVLRGADDGEHHKLAIRRIELSTSFSRSINQMAEEELEEDPLQQVMATTLEEELSPPDLDEVASYFTPADGEAEFQDLVQEANLEPYMFELKQLPPRLKYVFLNDDQSTPVIINDKLLESETQKLVATLEKYRSVIGYALKDLKGISLSLCTHRIPME
jgi:hypothetical protein